MEKRKLAHHTSTWLAYNSKLFSNSPGATNKLLIIDPG